MLVEGHHWRVLFQWLANPIALPCRYGLYILVGLVVPLGVFMVYGAFNRGSSPAPGTLVLWFGLAG